MLLRGYRDTLPQWAPDPGEVTYARRGPKDKFVPAVIEKVWRNRAGLVRIRVVWLGDDPNASLGERDRNPRGSKQAPKQKLKPVAKGEIGWLTLHHPVDKTPLLRPIERHRVPKGLVKRHTP